MKLKEIREERGISQSQAARDLNLSPSVYWRYETGQREPSNIVLLAIADYFNVSVDELLGRDFVQPTEQEQLDEFSIFKQKMKNPEYKRLIDKAGSSKPEHIKAAVAVLDALEPMA